MKTAAGYHYYQDYRDCERKFYWRSIRGYVLRIVDLKLSLGTLVHVALSWFHRGETADAALQRAVIDTGPVEEQITKDAAILVTGYTKWKPKEPLQVVYTERELVAELSPGIPYTGRIDLEATDTAQRPWILDFKTTRDQFGRFFRKYVMDWQMTGYVWLKAQHGPAPAGFIMRAIRKLKKPKFGDRKFLVSKSLLQNFQRQHISWYQEIEARRAEPKEHWRQDTKQCVTIFGECPFLKLCLNPRTEEATLEAYYEREA